MWVGFGGPFYEVYQYNIGNINDLTDIYAYCSVVVFWSKGILMAVTIQ